MTKLRLVHKGKEVAVEVHPDAAKVTTHDPMRFRIGYGVSVSTGINTFFMSRQVVEEVQLNVLTEILEASQPGSDEIIESAGSRISHGQATLVRLIREVGRLTHPDILMLVDMRQNSQQYVNSTSSFFPAFSALARKVMDLSFYATTLPPYPKAQRRDFIKITGAVTRGMDQFIYCTPNASFANQYVNFSVIPAGNSYEDVRFPTYYDVREGTKKKIPKTRFTELYAYYVNELFDCYRRYIRLLGAADVLATSDAEINADVFVKEAGSGPGEGGAEAEALIEGLDAEADAQQQADAEAIRRAEEESDRAAQLERERQAEAQRQVDKAVEPIETMIAELKAEQSSSSSSSSLGSYEDVSARTYDTVYRDVSSVLKNMKTHRSFYHAVKERVGTTHVAAAIAQYEKQGKEFPPKK